MNLHHLSVFREVMKTGSMSQAAQNLGRTQPAVSLALKNLEASLGITLFDRDTRNLKPVPEAYYLLAEADSMLNQMSQLQRTMKRMQVGDEGEVQLAVMPGVSTVMFPEFLSSFAQSYPNSSLSLHTRSSTQLRELVSSQGIDFGFGDYDDDHSRTQQTRVTKITGNSFLALPAGHPLTAHDRVPMAALNGITMGGMQPDHRFERRVQDAFTKARITSHIRFRSQTVLPLLKFVEAGQCCAIVDPLTVSSTRLMGVTEDAVSFRMLADPIAYEYAILVPKLRRLSALARHLARDWQTHLEQTLTELGAGPSCAVLD